MSAAIAKALPTCIFRTHKQVGFALGRKLLLGFTNLLETCLFLRRAYLTQAADSHSQYGFWR
jgi:hypothetical protein